MSILSTSAIFTRRHNFPLTAGLERLHTYVETMDFGTQNLRGQVAQNISIYVSDHTNNKIRDELLPDIGKSLASDEMSNVTFCFSFCVCI